MNLPENACPVAYTCIREYTDSLAASRALNHDVFSGVAVGFGGEDDWDEMREESLSHPLEPKTIRLRAFFAVELIYNELLPMQFFAAALSDHQKEWQDLRVDRTVEGMKWLEEKALKTRKRFQARSTIAILKRDDRLIQLGFALAKPAETFEKLAKVCDVLAGCLRRDDIKGMTIVGSHLAWSLQNAHQTLVEAERMVRALLSVGASNPIHSWQREE